MTTATNGLNWKVSYTRHPGRWDDPSSSVDFAEFVRCEKGNELESAFLTTFEPWTLLFLKRHFENVSTTLFVGDRVIDGCDCCKCDRALQYVGGLVWTCKECDDDVCNDCVGQEPGGVKTCAKGHPLEELHPGMFDEEDGAKVSNSRFDEDLECYRAEVLFEETSRYRMKCLRLIVSRKAGTFRVHPKLMILNFGKFVRIVISSFNMSEEQWEKAGDVFWWADLPLNDHPNYHLTRLGREPQMHAPLHDILHCMGATDANALLDRADWHVLHKHLGVEMNVVASVPGEHSDRRFGMRRLGDVLRQLPHFPQGCPVQMQVWSMGGSAPFWYNCFVSELTQTRTNCRDIRKDFTNSIKGVRFVVQTLGKGNYGSFDQRMFTNAHLWEDKKHPLMHSTEDSPVPWGWHSKVMYRMYPPSKCRTEGCTRMHGWAYVGSHNCSAASWGLPRKGNTTIRNFELGLVISSFPAVRHGAQCGIDLKDAVPIPWSGASNLVRYEPTPEFISHCVSGVKAFKGNIVSNESTSAKDCLKATVTPLRDALRGTSDSSDDDSDNDEESDCKERIVNIPRKLWNVQCHSVHEWPPPVGMEIIVYKSDNFGITLCTALK